MIRPALQAILYFDENRQIRSASAKGGPVNFIDSDQDVLFEFFQREVNSEESLRFIYLERNRSGILNCFFPKKPETGIGLYLIGRSIYIDRPANTPIGIYCLLSSSRASWLDGRFYGHSSQMKLTF